MAICYDGEHHRCFTAAVPGQPPITLDGVRDQAMAAFNSDKAALMAKNAEASGSDKTRNLRQLMLAKYTEIAPHEPLPQHPELASYIPNQQRLLVVSKAQWERFRNAVMFTVDGVSTEWMGLDCLSSQLKTKPNTFAQRDACSAAGLQEPLMDDINNIASPLHLTDVGLLSKLLIFPTNAKHPRSLQLTPSEWSEADRVRWLVGALANGHVSGLAPQTVTAMLWRELQQAYMDLERLKCVWAGQLFQSRFMCPLASPKSGCSRMLFEDYHHKIKCFIQLIMRQVLGDTCPQPSQAINDASMLLLQKAMLHNAANSVHEQQRQVLAKDLPPITGQHAMQVINGKADDQNVPCALAFLSCSQLADELDRMTCYEQATMMRCLARE